MTLVAALGANGGSGRLIMQPLCPNVTPRAAEAEKIVALLQRCHSQRRQLKAADGDSAGTPRSRALSAETRALAPAELELLRQFKEGTSSSEWARLKRRAKAACAADAQQNRQLSPLGLASTTPRTAAAQPQPLPSRRLQAAEQQIKKLGSELAAKTRQIDDLQSSLTAAKAKAAEVPAPAPAPARVARQAISPGALVSAPCTAMLEAIDTESKVVSAGVSECLDKELSSDGKDDMDITALHQLDDWARRAELLCKDAALLAPVLPEHLRELEPGLRATCEYVRSLRVEVQGRVFARREKAYGEIVADQHTVVAVPADGNCFFWSAHLASAALDSKCEPELSAVARAHKLAASDCQADVHTLRSRLCGYMRQNMADLKPEMIDSCVEALTSQERASTLRDTLTEQLSACITLQTSGTWDGSAAALCACAREALRSAGGEACLEACEIYCSTFSRPGVFAERLQIQCLADLLGRNIKLFYYTGGEATPAKGVRVTPAEVFRPVEASGHSEALTLLHQPSGRHFDLIVEGNGPLDGKGRAAAMNARGLGSPSHVRTLDMHPTSTTSTHDAAMVKPKRRARGAGGGWACGRRKAEKEEGKDGPRVYAGAESGVR